MRIWNSWTVCCCWCWQSHRMTTRLKWAFPQFDYSPKAGPSDWSLELLPFSYLCTLGHSLKLCTLGHSSELKTIHCHIVIELHRLLSILDSPLVLDVSLYPWIPYLGLLTTSHGRVGIGTVVTVGILFVLILPELLRMFRWLVCIDDYTPGQAQGYTRHNLYRQQSIETTLPKVYHTNAIIDLMIILWLKLISHFMPWNSCNLLLQSKQLKQLNHNRVITKL
jgi:hypothetical protein